MRTTNTTDNMERENQAPAASNVNSPHRPEATLSRVGGLHYNIEVSRLSINVKETRCQQHL
mgnify:CR=1 FL=1